MLGESIVFYKLFHHYWRTQIFYFTLTLNNYYRFTGTCKNNILSPVHLSSSFPNGDNSSAMSKKLNWHWYNTVNYCKFSFCLHLFVCVHTWVCSCTQCDPTYNLCNNYYTKEFSCALYIHTTHSIPAPWKPFLYFCHFNNVT